MGRSRNGIEEASASSYRISFYYKGTRCKESVKLKPSPANLKRVQNFLGAIKKAIEDGTFDYAVTFPDSPRRLKFVEVAGDVLKTEKYLEDWLSEVKPRLKNSTYDDYRKIVFNTLNPMIGHINLSDLKRKDVKDGLKPLRVSNKRLANIQSVLRSALGDAVSDDILEVNPLSGWTFVRKEAIKTADDVDPFTAKEQEAILASAAGQERNLFQFAFWTGMRTSELVALDWTDIDWERRVAKITKAMTQASDEAEVPKTAAGIREVKLLEPALKALMDQKAYTLLSGKEVFQNPRTSKRWSGDNAIRNAWVPVLKSAGVRYRRPYQTRHTYASMMLSAGESPMWVAQQMGHSDWGMIRRTYGRFIPDTIPDAGNLAVRIFGK